MWTLTSDDVQRIKEELKGRRAAIQARYADEIKLLEADLADIETMERVANAFAVRHLVDEVSGEEGEPVALVEDVAELEASLPDVDTVAPEPAGDSKGASRWRMRLNREAEVEPS
jgi:hypothetical protein